MARLLFGGSSDDYAVDSSGRPITGRRVRFYTSAVMSTEITDLASDAAGTGSPLTVTTDAHGFWGPVYGPDAVMVMYAGTVDAAGNPPTFVVAVYTHTSTGGGAAGVATFNGRTGAVSLSKADVTGTALAAADVGADTSGAAATAQTAAQTYADTAVASRSKPRGAWAPTTAYAVNDVVTSGGAAYRCLVAHTSGASFSGAGTNWEAWGSAASPTGVPTVINVKDAPYNAKGDGSTDDTAAIQAAIDACATAGGGTVYLPAGTYIVSQNANVTDNTMCLRIRSLVELVGAGWASIIKPANSLPVAVVSVISNRIQEYGFGFRDFKILGNKANQGHSVDGIRVTGDSGTYVTIPFNELGVGTAYMVHAERVFVHDVSGNGISTIGNGGGESKIIGCVVFGAGNTGIAVDVDAQVTACTAAATGGDAFQIGTDSRAVNCKAYMANNVSAYGFRLSDYGVAVGCQIQESPSGGFYLNGNSCIVEAANVDGVSGPAFEIGAGKQNCRITGRVGGRTLSSGTYNPTYAVKFGAGAVLNQVALTVLNVATGYVFGSTDQNDVSINASAGSQSPTFASTLTPSPYSGATVVQTLTGNLTVATPTTGHKGQRLRFVLTQDTVGARTVTFSSAYLLGTWTPDTTAQKTNVIDFIYDGAHWQQTGGQTGVAAPAPVVLDTFTAANGTTLSGRTPDSGPANWLAPVAGTWQVQGNAAQATAGTGDLAELIQTGVADSTASATMVLSTISRTNRGLIVRSDGTFTNCIIAILGSNCTIYKRVGGTLTSLATNPSGLANSSTHAVQLVAIGTTVTLYIDGTQYLTFSGTTGLESNTYAGMYTFANGASDDLLGTWDTFKVTA